MMRKKIWRGGQQEMFLRLTLVMGDTWKLPGSLQLPLTWRPSRTFSTPSSSCKPSSEETTAESKLQTLTQRTALSNHYTKFVKLARSCGYTLNEAAVIKMFKNSLASSPSSRRRDSPR